MHGENVDDTTARIVFSCLIYGDGLLLPGQDMKVKKTPYNIDFQDLKLIFGDF